MSNTEETWPPYEDMTLREIRTPEHSEWQCRISDNMVYVPRKGGHPNWFHRQMMRVFFGVKWEKRDV